MFHPFKKELKKVTRFVCLIMDLNSGKIIKVIDNVDYKVKAKENLKENFYKWPLNLDLCLFGSAEIKDRITISIPYRSRS